MSGPSVTLIDAAFCTDCYGDGFINYVHAHRAYSAPEPETWRTEPCKTCRVGNYSPGTLDVEIYADGVWIGPDGPYFANDLVERLAWMVREGLMTDDTHDRIMDAARTLGALDAPTEEAAQ